MEKPSAVKIAIKWTLIYFVTSVIITYLFQFLNVDQSSPAKYLSYIPFIAFLLLAQKEYRDLLGGYLTFGEGFITGLWYGVFAGVLMAVFIYVYLGILSPQILDQSIDASMQKLREQGTMSADQIDNATVMAKKYGALFGAIGILFVLPIFGVIISLIGASIFKKERSPLDMVQEAEANNFS